MVWPDDFIDKVICGDALEVMRLMPDSCVDAVITDPPFGTGTREWDKAPSPEVWQQCKRVCPKGPIAIFGYAKQLFAIARQFEDMNLIGFIVWHKYNEPMVSPGLTRLHQDIAIWGSSLKQCKADEVREPYQFVANKALEKWFGNLGGKAILKECQERTHRLERNPLNPNGRRCTDLWRIAVNHHGFNAHLRLHPNQKPDELLSRLVRLLSDEGNTILDLYLGSGTTAVAAKQLGRHWIGVDISPECCAIARERIEAVLL